MELTIERDSFSAALAIARADITEARFADSGAPTVFAPQYAGAPDLYVCMPLRV